MGIVELRSFPARVLRVQRHKDEGFGFRVVGFRVVGFRVQGCRV